MPIPKIPSTINIFLELKVYGLFFFFIPIFIARSNNIFEFCFLLLKLIKCTFSLFKLA